MIRATPETRKIIRALVLAHNRARLEQSDVAKIMNVSQPRVCAIELNQTGTWTIPTLRKFADAVGCDLEIQLIPKPSTED